MNRDNTSIRNKLLQAFDPTFSFQNQILTFKHTQPVTSCIPRSTSRVSLSRETYINEHQILYEIQDKNNNARQDHSIYSLDSSVGIYRSKSCSKKKKKFLSIVSNPHKDNFSRAETKSLAISRFSHRKTQSEITLNQQKNQQLKRSCSQNQIRENNYKANILQDGAKNITKLSQGKVSQASQQICSIKNQVLMNPKSTFNRPNPMINAINNNIEHMPIQRKKYPHLVKAIQPAIQRSFVPVKQKVIVQIIEPKMCEAKGQIIIGSNPMNQRSFLTRCPISKENVNLTSKIMEKSRSPFENSIKMQNPHANPLYNLICQPLNNQKPVFRTIVKRQLSSNAEALIQKNNDKPITLSQRVNAQCNSSSSFEVKQGKGFIQEQHRHVNYDKMMSQLDFLNMKTNQLLKRHQHQIDKNQIMKHQNKENLNDLAVTDYQQRQLSTRQCTQRLSMTTNTQNSIQYGRSS